jgi:hypothetical protein
MHNVYANLNFLQVRENNARGEGTMQVSILLDDRPHFKAGPYHRLYASLKPFVIELYSTTRATPSRQIVAVTFESTT